MKIIDAHTHIFPDKIAQKAAQGIGDFYSLDIKFDGTANSLLKICDDAGVSQCLISSVATTPSQVQSINTFIREAVKKYPGRFIGFASIHPHSKSPEKQIEDAIAAGLKGIKLHPDFQEFDADSYEAFSVLEIIGGRLPVLIHAGDNRKRFSSPGKILKLCKAFPGQTFIAAHMGGWSEWGICARELSECGVYVDTSSTQPFITPQRMRELIDIFTPDRVLFGTDYPVWSAADEISMLNKILKDNTEAEKIYHLNFEHLCNA